MAEHAAPARKPAGSAAQAKAPAAARPGSLGEVLNRRSEAALAGCAQLLADRAAANPLTAPLRAPGPQPVQLMPNRTGLPDGLKSGVEALSGLSMDDVRVHRNSSAPAKLGALAYAQGSDIHLGPGQDRHLPHEAWHVVQQKQGRVRATMQMKDGIGVNDDSGLEREADIMGATAARGGPAVAPAQVRAASVGAPVAQAFSLWAPALWPAYRDGLGERPCNAIDTPEAHTTLREVHNAAGQLTNRVITLHTYRGGAWGLPGAWGALGSVTMDRAQVPAEGPALHGGPAPVAYDDSTLTLHTAAAGGAGNAGVATHLFPRVLQWIDANLRGVQRINMNPAGGAASKSIIETLAGRLGDPGLHALANQARTARRNAGGAPIGSGAGAGALNTWDTRLNNEHLHDLQSLDAAPQGLAITGDAMTLAGPAPPGEIQTLRMQRDWFVNRPGGDLTRNVNHPAADHFEAARALTDHAIAGDPRSAAQILRIARLSSRSGANGTGGLLDAGYQIALSGTALAQVMPLAVG